jgi:diacylglycerol kinase (ATP)
LLNVTIIDAANRRRVLARLPSVYRGTHLRRPEVQVVRTERVRIESPDINAYADGELLGPLPVDVSVRPRALTLLVPAQ